MPRAKANRLSIWQPHQISAVNSGRRLLPVVLPFQVHDRCPASLDRHWDADHAGSIRLRYDSVGAFWQNHASRLLVVVCDFSEYGAIGCIDSVIRILEQTGAIVVDHRCRRAIDLQEPVVLFVNYCRTRPDSLVNDFGWGRCATGYKDGGPRDDRVS